MSDDNQDHNEPHDHAATEEHGATAESWHGHEPPIDDFSDPASEEATVSEETDPVEEMAVPVEITRRSPVAMIAVAIVGGVLLIGAVMYWQFGSMLHSTPQTPRPISVTQNATPKPLPSDLVKNDGMSQNGMAQPAPPASETQLPPVQPAPAVTENHPAAAAPSPASSSQTTQMAPVAAAPSPVAPVDPASIPVTNAPSVTAAAPAAPLVATSSAPQQPAAPAPSGQTSSPPSNKPVVADAQNDSRVAELAARVDALQKALTQATQELTQIGDKVSGTAAAPAGTSTDVNERIARLEQMIAQLQQQRASGAAKTKVAATAETDSQPVVVHKKHHAKTASARSHGKAAAQESKSSGRWVLRAASPDEAWVSKTADSHDLRPIHVGDTLSGIGRVKSIEQVGDSWVVKGTSGSVH